MQIIAFILKPHEYDIFEVRRPDEPRQLDIDLIQPINLDSLSLQIRYSVGLQPLNHSNECAHVLLAVVAVKLLLLRVVCNSLLDHTLQRTFVLLQLDEFHDQGFQNELSCEALAFFVYACFESVLLDASFYIQDIVFLVDGLLY